MALAEVSGIAPPSGKQYEILDGDQEATVTEVGVTLRSYRVGGTDVIDGFGVERRPLPVADRSWRRGRTGCRMAGSRATGSMHRRPSTSPRGGT